MHRNDSGILATRRSEHAYRASLSCRVVYRSPNCHLYEAFVFYEGNLLQNPIIDKDIVTVHLLHEAC